MTAVSFTGASLGAGGVETMIFPRSGHSPVWATQNNWSIMNRQNNQELIVSGIHLELTPSLKYFVREKADRLFRHEERIVRLRVELAYDAKTDVAARFKAKGHIAIHGPDMNAIVAADECHKAISLLVDKLDRMLRRRARYFKVRRRANLRVAFDAALPGAVSA